MRQAFSIEAPMNDRPLIFDIHLDLSMNAMSWNRDLRWSQERIQRWEHIQGLTTDGVGEVDRGNGTVCFPEMRRGNVGLWIGCDRTFGNLT